MALGFKKKTCRLWKRECMAGKTEPAM